MDKLLKDPTAVAGILAQAIKDALAKADIKSIPTFPPGSVPIKVAARVYGKDENWIRAGIISGWLPIGIATRGGQIVMSLKEMDSKNGRISYHVSPKRLWEETGYVWSGEKNIEGR